MKYSNYKQPSDPIEWLSNISDASDGTSATRISPRNVDQAMQRGRQLRAKAMQDFSCRVSRSVASTLRQLDWRYRRWREVRQTEKELLALSPQMLKDIGIHRSQIPAVARGLDGGPNRQPRSAAPVQQLQRKAPTVNECCVDEAA